jgi:hypothetical protein
MKYCVGKMKCQFLGLKLEDGYECLNKSLVCEHQRIPIFPEDELLPATDLARIADALEKIARELEKRNKLKAATLRATIESDYLDEIMED